MLTPQPALAYPLFVLLLGATACTLGPEPPWRPMPPAPVLSQELKQGTLDLYAAISSGHPERAVRLYSQEPGRVFIGVTGSEYQASSDPRAVTPAELFIEPGSTIVPGQIVAYSDREAGWVVDRPTVRLRNGTELHLRLTLLWRNEYGIWKIVHSHASLAPGGAGP